jgi:hypothetical protein
LLPQATSEVTCTWENLTGVETIYIPEGLLEARTTALALLVLAGYMAATLGPPKSQSTLRPDAVSSADSPRRFFPGRLADAHAMKSLLVVLVPTVYLACVDLVLVWMLERIRTKVPLEWLGGAGGFCAGTTLLALAAGLLRSVQPRGWRPYAVLPALAAAVALEVLAIGVLGNFMRDTETVLMLGAVGNGALALALYIPYSKWAREHPDFGGAPPAVLRASQLR